MKRQGLVTLVGVIASLTVAIGLLTGGNGGIGEFCPRSLEYRTHREITVLGGSVPIWRSSPEQSELTLIQFAIEEGFISPQGEAEHWILVFHWNDAWRDGHGTLYRALLYDGEQIVAWSKADRERAELYWTEAFRRLQSANEDERYIGQVIFAEGWRMETAEDLKAFIEDFDREPR